MTVLEAFLQGVLQGFTEFLPVSSSGHLSLFQYFTGNSGETGFLFSILLHAGTLVAVCIVFFPTLWALLWEAFALVGDLCRGKFSARRMNEERRMLLFLLLSLVPLALIVALRDWVSGFSTDRDITVEGFCFLVTGCALLTASSRARGRKAANGMRASDALAIGAAQVVATMPGISRSGATISTGLLCGLERQYAVSYSFILGIPAVLGAIILETKDAVAEGVTLPVPVMLTGFVTAAVFGVLSIKLVQWLIKGDRFRLFGYYTLCLGIVVLTIGFIDRFTGYPIQGWVSSLL